MALVDDKVFVSDVYEVQNVDVSTGNLEFEGSIQVNGDAVSYTHLNMDRDVREEIIKYIFEEERKSLKKERLDV